jgi:hypothetical protein
LRPIPGGVPSCGRRGNRRPYVQLHIPTQLKAWIDRIAIAGKTFKYDANGVHGLAGGKRVIIALSRGDFYVAGAPSAATEHAVTYLRSIFEFIGVTDIEVIVAEGVNIGAEHPKRLSAPLCRRRRFCGDIPHTSIPSARSQLERTRNLDK